MVETKQEENRIEKRKEDKRKDEKLGFEMKRKESMREKNSFCIVDNPSFKLSDLFSILTGETLKSFFLLMYSLDFGFPESVLSLLFPLFQMSLADVRLLDMEANVYFCGEQKLSSMVHENQD